MVGENNLAVKALFLAFLFFPFIFLNSVEFEIAKRMFAGNVCF